MQQDSLFFERALLPTGWASHVRVDVADGVIATVTPDAERADSPAVSGVALPGMPNLHSHTFQRGMAGLAETRGPVGDSFWTWRQVMYRFLGALTPEDVEAMAAKAFMDMLETGFTAVAEFHYLHHAANGEAHADLAEMGSRIAAAAAGTGIGLTLLPVFYAHGGFGGAASAEGQRRFINDPGRFLRLVEQSRSAVAALPDARVGIAPHSLRAVTPETLAEVLAACAEGPVHIHVAEQVKEVDDCLAWSGRRPVEWLLDNVDVDERWCAIHATQMTPEETVALARSGAIGGLCPLTEASLGDGIFNGPEFAEAGGRYGVGSDSNIEITAFGELKQLEYSQRLKHRARNVMAAGEGASTGRTLYEASLAGGAQALGRRIGQIAPGYRADFVTLDGNHPDLAGLDDDRLLDAAIFVTGAAAIRSVIVGGREVVSEGRHRARDEINSRYAGTLRRLRSEA